MRQLRAVISIAAAAAAIDGKTTHGLQ